MFPESSSVVCSKPKQLRNCITTKYVVIREQSFYIYTTVIFVFYSPYFFLTEVSQLFLPSIHCNLIYCKSNYECKESEEENIKVYNNIN